MSRLNEVWYLSLKVTDLICGHENIKICFRPELTKYYFVYLGLLEKYPAKTTGDYHLLAKVSEVITHEKYDKTNMRNDIALLMVRYRS